MPFFPSSPCMTIITDTSLIGWVPIWDSGDLCIWDSRAVHQHPGTLGSVKSILCVPLIHPLQSRSCHVRHHHCSLLQQARGYVVNCTLCGGDSPLGLGALSTRPYCQQYIFPGLRTYLQILSRKFITDHEWELHNAVVTSIDYWGILTRDLFTSHATSKCTQYCSSRGCSASFLRAKPWSSAGWTRSIMPFLLYHSCHMFCTRSDRRE